MVPALANVVGAMFASQSVQVLVPHVGIEHGGRSSWGIRIGDNTTVDICRNKIVQKRPNNRIGYVVVKSIDSEMYMPHW